MRLLKTIFKNENASTGILYLVSNDMLSSAERLYDVYQKWWRIEEYHKSIKQNGLNRVNFNYYVCFYMGLGSGNVSIKEIFRYAKLGQVVMQATIERRFER